MALTNTELAQKLDDVATGWQGFVVQNIGWLTSTAATVTLTDPDTLQEIEVKTPFQLQADYEATINPVAGIVAKAEAWANYPYGQLVPYGDLVDDYSALHWATKASLDVASVAGSEAAAAASAAAALASEGVADAAAVAADASKTASAASAAAALASEGAAAADAAATAADVLATAADVLATGADVLSTAADAVATDADRTATGADAVATAADRVQVADDRAASNSYVNAAGIHAGDALASAGVADTAATDAVNAQIGALTAQQTASDWAEKAEDIEVTTGKYSALHWAAKAEAWAGSGSAIDWTIDQGGTMINPANYVAGSGGGVDWAISGAEVIHASRYTDTIYTHPANHDWSILSGKPTTLAGYGITDAAPSSHVGGTSHIDWTVFGAEMIHTSRYLEYAHPVTHPWSMIDGRPATLAGYGIGDALSASHAGGNSHIDWTVTGVENIHADRYTDTVYVHPTTAGNKHVPTGGTVGQVLENSASGTAVWADKPKWNRSITIEDPASGEDISWFYVENTSVLTKLMLVAKGTSPSISVTLRCSTDRNAAGTVIDTNVVTSTTTGHLVTTFDSASIPAGSFVWIETASATGTIDSISLYAFGTE